MAYISNSLTHWVGKGRNDPEKFTLLVDCILRERELLFNQCSHDFSEKWGGLAAGTKMPMICFTDVPFSECGHLSIKYSKFGLCFEKHYLANLFASPVCYAANPFMYQNFSRIIHTLSAYKKQHGPMRISRTLGDNKTEIVDLDLLISNVRYIFAFFNNYSKRRLCYNEVDPSIPPEALEDVFTDQEAFYYEREWRMYDSPGTRNAKHVISKNGKNYLKFNEEYLKYVILPRKYAKKLQGLSGEVFKDYLKIPTILTFEDALSL